MVSIRFVDYAEFPEVSEFYRETEYAGAVLPSDKLVIAVRGSELVGVYRLAREHGALVLRGMRVHASARHQGVGTRLLDGLRGLKERCYCVAHAHLESFYGRAGFVSLREEHAPPFLSKRLAEYQAQGLNVRIMRREPGSVSDRADAPRKFS